jgi:hypothetical protein
MPATPHVEAHFEASDTVRDVVIAGRAEIAAGSIAMGLGGYLAARNSEQTGHVFENSPADLNRADVRGGPIARALCRYHT